MLKYFTHSHFALVVADCSCVLRQCSRSHYIHLRIVARIFLHSNVLKKLIDLKFFSLFQPWPSDLFWLTVSSAIFFIIKGVKIY